MDNILALITLALSCYFLLCIIKPSGITEFGLVLFIISTALIITWGYILSAMNQLGNMSYWQNIGLVTAIALFSIVVFSGKKFIWHSIPALPSRLSIKKWCVNALGGYSLYAKLVLLLLALTAIMVGTINLILILTIAPHEWDSMTYHLPRMAHYLQQNNLNYFDANYWAQVVQPKNSTLLLLYSFLALGRNENLTQLPQYFSYWVIVISIYGISRKIGFDRIQGMFSALVGSLLIGIVTQANTTQNDLNISAYFAATTFFLFTFRETSRWKYLYLAAMGIGIAIGTKASALIALPSIILISLALTRTDHNPKIWLRNLSLFYIFVLLAVFAFAFPSGYLENYRLFGNPFGNQDVSNIHTFSGKPIEYIVRGGFYNILRYGIDSLSFNGLPPMDSVNLAQRTLHFFPQRILSLLNINLETLEATSFSWFEYGRPPGGIYWGVLGFGLIWIITFLSLFRIIKRPDFFLLSLAAAAFWVSMAYSGPYDAAKGRYFSISAAFVVPLTGICLNNTHRAFRVYLTIVILLGCISAISAAVIKTTPLSATYPELLKKNSIFYMDRIEQLTFSYYTYYKPLVVFERLVPSDASVAVFLYPNTFEYPLYGENLTRKIIPINSFYKGLQPIPPDAQFLLYAKGYPCPLPDDRNLSAGWFLRELTTENRDCSSATKP
ncbi:MAG: glycosyltransferase family 39 protein [Anaerolineales bacterium]|nr:glycosyltransferase family 39 protein [Anaerolineales bacterium]